MASITLRNVKGSALTFTEMDGNFTNLNNDKLENVSEDSTPQLGGNLDVNGHSIVSASGGNIAITPDTTGSIILDGLNWPQADGTNGYVLQTNGAGQLSWATPGGITYTIDAITDGANANLRLIGSNATTDDIQLVAGTNIALTVDSAGAITIDATDTDTTYSISAVTDGANANLRLTGSDASTDDIQLVAGTNITLTVDSAGAITIDATDTNTNTTYTVSAVDSGSDAIIRLTGSDASTDDITLAAGSNITITPAGDTITIAATDTGITDVVQDTTPQLGGDLDTNSNDIVGSTAWSLKGGSGVVNATVSSSGLQNVILDHYRETTYDAGSTSGNVNFDPPTNGHIQRYLLTGNITFTGFSGPSEGESVTVILEQDATGSRTFSEGLDSAGTMLWAGGDSTLSTTAGAIDIISIVYTGGIYYASLSKNFS